MLRELRTGSLRTPGVGWLQISIDGFVRREVAGNAEGKEVTVSFA